MKKILFIAALVFASISGVKAQNFLGDFSKMMGNLTVNYKNAQVSVLLNQHYGVPVSTLNSLYVAYDNNWGDVAAALELSYSLNKPVSEIHTKYKKDKRRGWGVIAQDFGVKPGSAQFKRMKSSMNQKNTYWKGVFDNYSKNRDPKIAHRNRTAMRSDLYSDFDHQNNDDHQNKKHSKNKDEKSHENKGHDNKKGH